MSDRLLIITGVICALIGTPSAFIHVDDNDVVAGRVMFWLMPRQEQCLYQWVHAGDNFELITEFTNNIGDLSLRQVAASPIHNETEMVMQVFQSSDPIIHNERIERTGYIGFCWSNPSFTSAGKVSMVMISINEQRKHAPPPLLPDTLNLLLMDSTEIISHLLRKAFFYVEITNQASGADQGHMEHDIWYVDRHCLVMCAVVVISAVCQVSFIRKMFKEDLPSRRMSARL